MRYNMDLKTSVFVLLATCSLIHALELGKSDDLVDSKAQVTNGSRGGRNDDYPSYQPLDRRPDEQDDSDYSGYYENGDSASRGSTKGDDYKPPSKTPSGFHDFVPGSSYPPPPPIPGRPSRYYGGKSYKGNPGGKYNNVWKGEPPIGPEIEEKPGAGDYYFPHSSKGPYLSPEQMLMIMSQLSEVPTPETDTKFGGLFGKFAADPVPYLVAIFLPLSLIVAAILPSIINMMMMNGGPPVVSTTATGNNGRNLNANSMALVEPVLKAIGKFGAKSLENPDCMQRIFCQVTIGQKSNSTEATAFQKVIQKASRFVDESWLQSFGIKALVKSLSNGNCDQIPCQKKSKAKGDKAAGKSKDKKSRR